MIAEAQRRGKLNNLLILLIFIQKVRRYSDEIVYHFAHEWLREQLIHILTAKDTVDKPLFYGCWSEDISCQQKF
jgi:hypothetical protein